MGIFCRFRWIGLPETVPSKVPLFSACVLSKQRCTYSQLSSCPHSCLPSPSFLSQFLLPFSVWTLWLTIFLGGGTEKYNHSFFLFFWFYFCEHFNSRYGWEPLQIRQRIGGNVSQGTSARRVTGGHVTSH